MSDTVKLAIHRLASSTAPTGVITGSVGPFKISISTDGTTPVVTGISSSTEINAGSFDLNLIRKSTLASAVLPTDYVVRTKAEFDTLMSDNDDATLSGKVIEFQNDEPMERLDFGYQRTFDPALILRGDGLAPRVVDSWLIQGIHGLTFGSGLKTQHQHWPKIHGGLIEFGSGARESLDITLGAGSEWCHGYGPNLDPIDVGAEYPEYARIDNVITASTSSTRTTLDREYPGGRLSFIDFFNRGSEGVWVSVGDSNVTASVGTTDSSNYAAPGARLRIGGVGAEDTHVAVITSTGTSECNARAEQGLPFYLIDLLDGSSGCKNLHVIGAHIHDVRNAVKLIRILRGNLIIDSNRMERVYMDVVAGSADESLDLLQMTRNLTDRTFSRSGISEDQNGDAGDPHGDWLQIFNGWSGNPNARIVVAGNSTLDMGVREGVSGQGLFNQASPSDNIWAVGNLLLCGENRGFGIYSGHDIFMEHNTVLDPRRGYDSFPKDPAFELSPFAGYQAWSNKNVYGTHIDPARDGLVIEGENYVFTDPNLIFADWSAFTAATTLAEIRAAATTVGEAEGFGAVWAQENIINYDPNVISPEDMIDWSQLDPGVRWDEKLNVEFNTPIVFEPRKYLNYTDQTVVAEAGTEFQITDMDGTIIVPWTSGSATISRTQLISLRKTSSADGLTVSEAAVTFGDKRVAVQMTTKAMATDGIDLVGYTSIEYVKPYQAVEMPLTNLSGGIRSAPQEGDLVLVAIASADKGERESSMESAGYTQIGTTVGQLSDRSITMAVYGKFMGSTPDTSVSVRVNNASSGTGMAMARVYDSVTAGSLSTMLFATNSSTGSTVNPPSVSPTVEGCMGVSFGAIAHAFEDEPIMSSPDLQKFAQEGRGLGGRDVIAGLASGEMPWDGSNPINPGTWNHPVVSGDSAVSMTLSLAPN